MAVASKHGFYPSLIEIASAKSERTRSVICCNNDESMAIGCSPFKHISDSPVEVKQFLHSEVEAAGMTPVVDAGTFEHHYKTRSG